MVEKRVVTTIRLSPEMKAWVESEARAMEASSTRLVEVALEELRARRSGLEEAPVAAAGKLDGRQAKEAISPPASPRAPAEKPVDSRPRDRMGRLTPSSFKSREAYLGYLRRGER